MHPIGERTSDVWPIRLAGKPAKWSREDVWKAWAERDKELMFAGAEECAPVAMQDLIQLSLSADPRDRPSMNEFEDTLWDTLRAIDRGLSVGLGMQLDYLDSFGSNSESRRPHMADRLYELRKFYAGWG